MTLFSRNGTRTLLIASLALNVFAIDWGAAHWTGFGWHHRDDDGPRAASAEGHGDNGKRMRAGSIVGLPSPRRLMDVLSEDGRAHLTQSWRDETPRIRNEFRALFDARDHVADVLSRQDYQRKDLEDAFSALRARQMELTETSQGFIIDLADHIGAEERDRLAALMRPPKEKGNEKPAGPGSKTDGARTP